MMRNTAHLVRASVAAAVFSIVAACNSAPVGADAPVTNTAKPAINPEFDPSKIVASLTQWGSNVPSNVHGSEIVLFSDGLIFCSVRDAKIPGRVGRIPGSDVRALLDSLSQTDLEAYAGRYEGLGHANL